MRTLLVSCVFLIALTAARAEEKPNTLTAEQENSGWKLLFDGENHDELLITGNCTTEEGVLVLGGGLTSRVGPREKLSGNFEWRMEYRVTDPRGMNIFLESKGAFSGWSTGRSMPQPSGNPDEWRSLRITGRLSRDTGASMIVLHLGEGGRNTEHQLGGYPAAQNLTVALQVPPGTKLYLRNVLLKADPPSQRGLYSLYVMVGGLVAVVLALILFAYWRSTRRRALED